MSPGKVMFGVGTLVSVLLAVSCGSSAGRPSDQAAGAGSKSTGPGQIPVIAAARVVSQQLDQTVRLPGELAAYQDVAVYAKVQGFVQRIPVDRGSAVKRGDLLVEMTAPELVARRDEAEAQVRAAQAQRLEASSKLESIRAQKLEAESRLAADEATFQRLKAASATPGVVAGNDLDIAQKTAEADRASVRAWEENERAAQVQIQSLEENEKAAVGAARSAHDIEEYLRITAPFDGVVTERNVHEGSLAGPAAGASSPPMLRIQQVSLLRLVIYVPEYDVAGIKPGDRISFSVPAYPGETFTGVTRRIAHALDRESRTMPVELDVLNPSARLAPGMYADVDWPLRRPSPSLFVPSTSIATTTEKIFVERISQGIVEWIEVRRGATVGNLAEVFGQLSPGDLVAVHGTDEIRAGMRVEVKIQ